MLKIVYYYEFQTHPYIHLFDECNQNWFSVASIIEDSLTIIRRKKSKLNEAFLRSDNAGCYHCAFLLLSLPSLGQLVVVRIARYDLSEAQAGKDICYRRAAALKSHIRRYINEGKDVKTASDMKEATDSHGGVKGCYSLVYELDERSHNMTKHSLSGIQSLNNFVFTQNGEMIAWRAYDVGPGKVFSAASLARLGALQGPKNLQVLQAFSSPDILTGVFHASSSSQEQQPAAPPTDPIAAFGCPEEGCIKVYQSHSSLQLHLDAGKHQSEARTAATVWNWSGKTFSPGALLAVLYFSSCHIFFRPFRIFIVPTICPWVSEDACCYVIITELASYNEKKNDVGTPWWAKFFLF